MRKAVLLVVSFGLCVAPAFAQSPDGVLSGRVSHDEAPLEGVEVSVSSPALQGSREAVTTASGDYVFHFLPAGTYEVCFAHQGYATLTTSLKVSAAQSHTVDAVMTPATMAGEITVTSARETISQGVTTATTFEQEVIDALPVGRDTVSATLLAPGTTDHGRFSQPSVSGSPFNETLYLVNGVDSRETVRGSALDLYIEDAVLETTVASSGISAEYGRFSGGVVSVVTRSGGNDLSGSLRLNLVNDSWTARTPLTVDREDEINQIWEGTLGGALLRDRLWYFLAGRDFSISRQGQTFFGEAYPTHHDQTRSETKLTFSPHPHHRLTFSWLDVDDEQQNVAEYTPADRQSLSPTISEPLGLLSLSYAGVLNERLFVEALFSNRDAELLRGSVTARGDQINGTPIRHYLLDVWGNDAKFCALCGPTETEQSSAMLKFSYLADTEHGGTHDLVAGYQYFSDRRKHDNYYSTSDFYIYSASTPTVDADGQYTPNIFPGTNFIVWCPVPLPSSGNEIDTQSVFVNDTWRLSNRVTLNLGLRYDQTEGSDATGELADHYRLSPRLGLTWDILGTAEWVLNVSAARYAAYLNQSLSTFWNAGSSWLLAYQYLGPDTTGLPANEALEVVFDWFDGEGGVDDLDLVVIQSGLRDATGFEDLKTPYADELTIGLTRRLGDRGLLRADYVHREHGDFFAVRTPGTEVNADLTPVGVEGSLPADLWVVSNENAFLSREYDGLHTQLQYRLTDELGLGATYTWSHTRGTFAGEAIDGQMYPYPDVGFAYQLMYPEYVDPSWIAARGDLPQDQRHKLRLWLLWDAFSRDRHSLSVSLLQGFTSGSPYGAITVVPYDQDTLAFIGDHGYALPPTRFDYWFEPSGTYRTDDVSSTDLALNYSFQATLAGVELELFLRPEITNLFNETATVREDATINVLATFNPFTEEPVEGVHWAKAPTFGQPLTPDDYQLPRTFRVSLGIRF